MITTFRILLTLALLCTTFHRCVGADRSVEPSMSLVDKAAALIHRSGKWSEKASELSEKINALDEANHDGQNSALIKANQNQMKQCLDMSERLNKAALALLKRDDEVTDPRVIRHVKSVVEKGKSSERSTDNRI